MGWVIYNSVVTLPRRYVLGEAARRERWGTELFGELKGDEQLTNEWVVGKEHSICKTHDCEGAKCDQWASGLVFLEYRVRSESCVNETWQVSRVHITAGLVRNLDTILQAKGSLPIFSLQSRTDTYTAPGVPNLLASLGHTLNTRTLTKTDEHKKAFKWIYDFVLGHTHSRPGLLVARGPRVGCPCL